LDSFFAIFILVSHPGSPEGHALFRKGVVSTRLHRSADNLLSMPDFWKKVNLELASYPKVRLFHQGGDS